MSFLPPLLFLDAFLLALAAEYEFMVGLWLIPNLEKMSSIGCFARAVCRSDAGQTA